ncbi:MAG: hypothetical protein OIF56_09705 [Cohaesibacter sp.]|nr:hypothetical protein [Cohaesibacter sp.]
MTDPVSQQQGSSRTDHISMGQTIGTLILVLAIGAALSSSPTTALERSSDGRFWSVICTSDGIFYVDLATGEQRKSDQPANQDQSLSCHSANSRRANNLERKTG